MGHSLFHAANAAAIDDESRSEEGLQQQQQSPQEIVHREHLKHHLHSHQRIHQRQSPADTSAAITEVTSTVSIIEQVDVDTNGSIFSTQDVPQTSTLPAATDATTSIDPGTTSSITPSATASIVASTSATIASISSQPSSDLTSIPSAAASTTTFATIITGSNATLTTGSTTSSGSLSTINLNSTASSSPSSSISVTSINSSTSVSSTSGSSTSSISSTQSSLTSSESFSSTSSSTFDSFSQTSLSSTFAGGIGATGTQTLSTATSSATSGAGNSSNGSVTPPTSTVIASVFGGIAGVGLILVFFLFLVKWHKRRLASNRPALGGSSDGGARDSTTPVNPSPSGGMSQRMSQRTRFAIPAGLANLTTSFKPNRASRQTMATISSTAGSERGFVRVSGRKIRSVLESGGDGFGDPPDPNMNIDGGSFYQDSHGFYGGPGSPTSPGPGRRSSGIANLRPSPARTPVIAHGAFSEHNADQPPPSRPDGGGRSRSGSNTGSHVSASRFTEKV